MVAWLQPAILARWDMAEAGNPRQPPPIGDLGLLRPHVRIDFGRATVAA